MWTVRWVVLLLLVLAAGMFLPGIGWGLPSREVDPYLFGSNRVWSGAEIAALADRRSPEQAMGADVDRTPVQRSDEPILLNATDEDRAGIILRYRLYSRQPDEMITLMALARMRPGQFDFDPRLYQYGGLWIYPVGAMLKAASWIGYLDLRPDLTYYLDHPEAFGRFYVVARLYSVVWGLVGVWAVFWITRRLTRGLLLPALAAGMYISMPIVINMAHEAKPHLAGAVLMLLAAIAGAKYVELRTMRYALLCGALCGAAVGMVISSLWALGMLPVMAVMARGWSRRAAADTVLSGGVGLAVYSATNPYLWINLLIAPEIVRSNIENSTAMYQIGQLGEGLLNAARLILMGTSPLLGIAGVVGSLVLVTHTLRGWGPERKSLGRSDVVCLLAVPCVLICLQFWALAAGKPAEYARFALLIDIALCVAAVVGVQILFRQSFTQAVAGVVLCLATLLFGMHYWMAFVQDEQMRALQRRHLSEIEGGTIALYAEPAPYSMPATNLFDRSLILMPPETPLDAIDTDLVLAPGGVGPLGRSVRERTPISWASKEFVVYQR